MKWLNRKGDEALGVVLLVTVLAVCVIACAAVRALIGVLS